MSSSKMETSTKTIGYLNMTTRVSVIIPYYNNKNFINRCLRSLEAQTLPKHEFDIILVDDGSDEKFQPPELNKELNFRYCRHDTNRGLPSALNTALAKCETQYFVRVDSDDYVQERFLELLIFKMTNSPGLLGAACDYWCVDSLENRISEHNAMEEPIGCGVIFKTDIIRFIGNYSEEMHMAEEIEFRKRVENIGKVGHLSLPLYRYVRHQNNMTNDIEKYQKYKDLLK